RAGLPHDLESVRDRLDAGERTASERVGPQEEKDHSDPAERGQPVGEAARDTGRDPRDRSEMREDGRSDEERMGGEEHQKNREKDFHRLFDAAEVQEDQERDGGVLRGKLPSEKRGGEKAEDGVAA